MNMRYSSQIPAEYGDMVSGPRVINAEFKKAMNKILKDIQEGSLCKRLYFRAKEGMLEMNAERRNSNAHNN